MIIDKDGNIANITQEHSTIIELVQKLTKSYNSLKHNNIIVNLTTLEKVTVEDIIEFLQISNEHRGSRHSFVIVSSKVDLDDMPDELVVVPTQQEAYDIIEMEEMERDLGF